MRSLSNALRRLTEAPTIEEIVVQPYDEGTHSITRAALFDQFVASGQRPTAMPRVSPPSRPLSSGAPKPTAPLTLRIAPLSVSSASKPPKDSASQAGNLKRKKDVDSVSLLIICLQAPHSLLDHLAATSQRDQASTSRTCIHLRSRPVQTLNLPRRALRRSSRQYLRHLRRGHFRRRRSCRRMVSHSAPRCHSASERRILP